MNTSKLIRLIQLNLTPELLNKQWAKKQNHPLQGHCYVASEVLWHLLNKEEWKPMCAVYWENGEKQTHWWLEHKLTKRILDPTKAQYGKSGPPYHLGKGCGFLTRKPSKRASLIFEKLRNFEKISLDL